MNAAKPGEFDKAAFIKAVNDAIAKQAPKNLEEADKFGDSGKADAVKGEVSGKVDGGKKASAGQIESTTKAPPDTGAAKVKPVTPLKPDQPPGKPGTPDPAKAIPDKAPPAATDFSEGPKQVNEEMARGAGQRGAAGPVQRAGVHRGPEGEEGRRAARRHRAGRGAGEGSDDAGGCEGRGAASGRDGDGRHDRGAHQVRQGGRRRQGRDASRRTRRSAPRSRRSSRASSTPPNAMSRRS